MPKLIKNKIAICATTLLLILFFRPAFADAQIIITEIMYNPESTDSGREWIELYNSGPDSVDLSNYKLLENGTNHRFSAYNSADLILLSQKYAIVADNPEKFLVDYPQNSNLLIDSAFSLNNTGEEISLIDPNDQSINTINYSVDWGANGTGNSLQLNGANWIPADPTPWQINKTEAEDETNDSSSDSGSDDSNSSGSSATSGSNSSDSTSTHSATNDLSDYKPKIDLKISAGRQRYTTINSPISFILEHNQDSDREISTKWSMGDGNLLRGLKISHTYSAAGTYNIVLNAKNKAESATARTKVFVKEPEIELNFQIRGKTVDILLKNVDKNEANLGGFQLKFANNRFEIAPDTILDPNKTLILSHKNTRFEFPSQETAPKPQISLYYPNGDKLTKTELFPHLKNDVYQKIYSYLDPEEILNLDSKIENLN